MLLQLLERARASLLRVPERFAESVSSNRPLDPFPSAPNDPFPAGAHPLDWRRSGLGPFGRTVCRSFTEALLADQGPAGELVPPDDGTLDRVVHKLDLWLGTSTPDLGRAFFALCLALQTAAPVMMIDKPYRFTKLSLADRLRVLERLEEHENGLFSMLLTAFKIPLATAAFEEGELLSTTGFPRPDLIMPRPSGRGAR
jgi:hypothetical protein